MKSKKVRFRIMKIKLKNMRPLKFFLEINKIKYL